MVRVVIRGSGSLARAWLQWRLMVEEGVLCIVAQAGDEGNGPVPAVVVRGGRALLSRFGCLKRKRENASTGNAEPRDWRSGVEEM